MAEASLSPQTPRFEDLTTRQPKAQRRLTLKFVEYAQGRRKEFAPDTAHDLVTMIYEHTENIGERTWRPGGENGQHHFINRVRRHRYGCSFQICSYLPGAMPNGALPDHSQQELDIQTVPVIDPETKQRLEIMTVMHVLAYGQVMIVEGVRKTGGVQTVAQYLTNMTRKVRGDSKYPSLRLMDVANADLRKAIDHGGGVESMQISLVEQPARAGDGTFATLLGRAKEAVGRTRRVAISWQGIDTLETDTVVEAVEECEEDPLIDGVVLRLRNGGAIQDFGKYRESRVVEVRARGPGTPDSGALVEAMQAYLIRLQTPEAGYRVVTEEGGIAPGVRVTDD